MTLTGDDFGDVLVGMATTLAVCVVIGLLVRHWPFAWRATVRHLESQLALTALCRREAEAEAARCCTEAQTEHSRADDLNRRMTSMQDRFGEAMRDLHEPWSTYAGEVLRMVQDRSFVCAFVSEPDVRRVRDDPMENLTRSPFREYRAELVQLAVGIHLTPDCPPELVADRIADQVRTAVLRQWQSQSVLTNGLPQRRVVHHHKD